jgi:hypothetical protein
MCYRQSFLARKKKPIEPESPVPPLFGPSSRSARNFYNRSGGLNSP